MGLFLFIYSNLLFAWRYSICFIACCWHARRFIVSTVFIVGHFAVVLPIAFGRGKCEAGDGSAPDDADIGAVADDGRCSECH